MREFFTVQIPAVKGHEYSFELISYTGKLISKGEGIFQNSETGQILELNISNNSKGLYLLKVRVNDDIYTEKNNLSINKPYP